MRPEDIEYGKKYRFMGWDLELSFWEGSRPAFKTDNPIFNGTNWLIHEEHICDIELADK